MRCEHAHAAALPGEYVLALASETRSGRLAVADSACHLSLYDRLTLQRRRARRGVGDLYAR